MTGPVMLLRQQSSTVGNPTTNNDHPPKLRRCSSADDSASLESISDDRYSKRKLPRFQSSTREYALSESDSGTEDTDQKQLLNFAPWTATIDNVDDEQASTTSTFGAATDDEGFSEHETVVESQGAEQISLIVQDLKLAAKIPDVEKKDFCESTRVAFHGEFARNIQIPIALRYRGARLTLITEDDFEHLCWGEVPQSAFTVRKIDNAKAQFKCPNKLCQHAWTSMRARISFLLTKPEYGLVVMKVYAQACQHCQTQADPLWYIDEVCRVMRNLRGDFNQMYPLKDFDFGEQQQESMMEWSGNYFRRSHHDPAQRSGKMQAMHDSRLCEACQHGVCFC